MAQWRHWGWPCSPFSVKTLSYMRFKGLDFRDEVPHLGKMFGRIRSTVGRIVIPVVITPDDTMLQDSTAIIDYIEAVAPLPNAWPETPLQRFVAQLIELFADEWVVLLGVHTRWSRPNREFNVADFGALAAPGLPRIAQKAIGTRVSRMMTSKLADFGIHEALSPAFEAWAIELLNALEVHFQAHRFLLGDAACVADFALAGPLRSHFERDPASSTLISTRPAVEAWIVRVRSGHRGTTMMAQDAVPRSLDPVLQRCFADQLPYLAGSAAALRAFQAENPGEETVPVWLGPAPVSFGGAAQCDKTRTTYGLWMLQRVLDVYDAAPDQAVLDAWLARAGGSALTTMSRPPRLKFERFKVRFA